MPSTDSPTVRARRQKLSDWIGKHYAGRQADFIGATGLNQGLVSALVLGPKSFGEKLAASIEEKADMPAGYLVHPLDAERAAPAAKRKTGQRRTGAVVEAEVEEITMVLGSLFTVMLRHRPAEAKDVLKQLDALPDKMQGGPLVSALRRVAKAGNGKARSA